MDRHVAALAEGARPGAASRPSSLTYWAPTHDTCTAECDAEFEDGPAERQAGWDRFANGPAPVGYDPAIIPMWTDPQAEAFGILRLTPRTLRVMDGTVMTQGIGSAAQLEGLSAGRS